MLQETHSIENDFLVGSMSGRVNFFVNNSSSNSSGNMIAFTKNFNFKMEKNMPRMPTVELKFAHITIIDFFQ